MARRQIEDEYLVLASKMRKMVQDLIQKKASEQAEQERLRRLAEEMERERKRKEEEERKRKAEEEEQLRKKKLEEEERRK